MGGGVGLMMGCYGTDVIDGVDARWMAVMVFVIVGFCTFVWYTLYVGSGALGICIYLLMLQLPYCALSIIISAISIARHDKSKCSPWRSLEC